MSSIDEVNGTGSGSTKWRIHSNPSCGSEGETVGSQSGEFKTAVVGLHSLPPKKRLKRLKEEDFFKPIANTGPKSMVAVAIDASGKIRFRRPRLMPQNIDEDDLDRLVPDLSLLSLESISKYKEFFFGENDPAISMNEIQKHFFSIPIPDPNAVVTTFIENIKAQNLKG